MNKELILKFDSEAEFQSFKREDSGEVKIQMKICFDLPEYVLKIVFLNSLGFSYELESDSPPLYFYEIKDPEFVKKKLIDVEGNIPKHASFHFYQIVDSHDNMLFEIVAESFEIFKETKSSEASIY